MKLKNFPEEISKVRVIVPDDILVQLLEFSKSATKEMYITSMWDEIVLTPDSPSAETRRIVPLPEYVFASEMLEWDIVEENLISNEQFD